MATEAAPGHPEIVRVVAPNPGPMTLEGTNTYVVATADGAYVIDPGPADAGHLEAVRAAAAGPIAGVLLTHSHADHSAGVGTFGGELIWGTVSARDELGTATESIEAGATSATQTGPFTVLPTPGHAPDHVAFVLGRVCFCGDLILGHGSTIVGPRAVGGSLSDYMASLDAIEALGAKLLAPGHGPWISEPAAKIAEYREHRLERERRLVASLDAGERSRAALLVTVWDDVPEVLRPAAAIAMEAHLEKLEAEGILDGIELGD